jgi:hypothetical protein
MTQQAYHSQPAAQAFSKADAKRARISYQHLAHAANLIVTRIIQTLDDEHAKAFTPSVFQTIHALHGMFNGREVSAVKPMFRKHLYTAPHFGFHDRSAEEIAEARADVSLSPGEKEERIADIRLRAENSAARLVCRRLSDLEEAEAACGRRLFLIRRADGTTQKLTSYEGHPLLDAAESLYHAARNSPTYAANPSAAITVEMLDEAVASLPTRPVASPVAAPSERVPMDSADLMTGAVLKGRWTKILNSANDTLVKEFDTGCDPEIVARKYAAKIIELGKDIKQRLARERLSALSALGDEDVPWKPNPEYEGSEEDGKNNVGQGEGGNDPADSDIHPDKYVPPPPSQDVEPQEVGETPISENENLMLQRALENAAAGIDVLPLWGVSDGVCDCPQGSECRTPGKHPHSTLARKQTPNGLLKGVYSATKDAPTITKWFEKDPRINYGLAMGGDLNLICVDIDPRNDGDASYFDLIDEHGEDAFPETFTVRTGGGGWHRLYRLPEVIKPKTGELKGKLGPGIDIKGAGGLIVGVGSVHASGRYYEVEDNTYIATAPEWIVNSLRKAAAGEQPEKVVDFQAHRDRKRAGISGSTIVEGERNERLFKIGCAIWGAAEAQDIVELHVQLLEINNRRCVPPVVDSEVAKIVGSIAGRYARGVAVQEAKAGGAA